MRAPVCLTALVACAPATAPDTDGISDARACSTIVSLIDATTWSVVPPPDDPFRRDPPLDAATSTGARDRCGLEDTQVEPLAGEPSYSIVTRRCGWGTAQAPLARAVPTGTPLTLRIWHYSLVRLFADSARLALAVEDRVVWERAIAVPSEGALIADEVVLDAPVAAGERLRWHVSNHGENSWNFLSLTARLDAACGAAP